MSTKRPKTIEFNSTTLWDVKRGITFNVMTKPSTAKINFQPPLFPIRSSSFINFCTHDWHSLRWTVGKMRKISFQRVCMCVCVSGTCIWQPQWIPSSCNWQKEREKAWMWRLHDVLNSSNANWNWFTHSMQLDDERNGGARDGKLF